MDTSKISTGDTIEVVGDNNSMVKIQAKTIVPKPTILPIKQFVKILSERRVIAQQAVDDIDASLAELNNQGVDVESVQAEIEADIQPINE